MKRLALSALFLLLPAAYAQQDDDRIEGQKLAAAFSQGDLDTLGACQGRIEGVGLLLGDIEGWLVAQGQTAALDGLHSQLEKGAELIDSFAEVRLQISTVKGMALVTSDKAREDMLATFKRREGEDERAFYTRAQPQTRLPADCREALRRGRWKIEMDGIAGDR